MPRERGYGLRMLSKALILACLLLTVPALPTATADENSPWAEIDQAFCVDVNTASSPPSVTVHPSDCL